MSKSMYIDCLVDMSNNMGAVTTIQDAGYLTYFTSIGTVVGKEATFAEVHFDSVEEFVEGYKEILAENSYVSLIEMAAGLFEHRVKHYLDEVPTDHQAIVLEDVQILTTNNIILNAPQFVLFKDQIIGISSEKLDLNQSKA